MYDRSQGGFETRPDSTETYDGYTGRTSGTFCRVAEVCRDSPLVPRALAMGEAPHTNRKVLRTAAVAGEGLVPKPIVSVVCEPLADKQAPTTT
jgi:hypothetical protein